jgi:transcriptional regulator with XRE-family HTH domain
MKSFKDMTSALSTERQKKIAARSQELIQGEKILRALRHKRHVTQKQLSEQMGIEQSAISRLENREDFLLSTLRTYIEALGGKLEIKACFPDEAIDLSSGLPRITQFQS